MKVYVYRSALATGKQELCVEQMIQELIKQNNKVITTHFAQALLKCDCAFFDVSQPDSYELGFEIGMFLSKDKPIILLYKSTCPEFLNQPMSNTRVLKIDYSNVALDEVVTWCLEEVKHMINRRFTMFISPRIDSYLNQIATVQGISRSEYIRLLIEENMKHFMNSPHTQLSIT